MAEAEIVELAVPLAGLGEVFVEPGLPANRCNSFDLTTSATCLAVEVVDGPHLGPRGSRLLQVK